MKYPSALISFEAITVLANGKRVALFLDYDGTLSPIVDNPANAVMSDEVCLKSVLHVQFELRNMYYRFVIFPSSFLK